MLIKMKRHPTYLGKIFAIYIDDIEGKLTSQ